MRTPHPIPYQGSKRRLAGRILAQVQGQRFDRLIEPFAGSAAISIAAVQHGIVERVVIGDSLLPLMRLWSAMLDEPVAVAEGYERLWHGQAAGDAEYYNRVRDEYNVAGDPVHLLYLLARCVKNSPRFNSKGGFSQSRDKRRLGMRPSKMRNEIIGVSDLFADKAEVIVGDFVDALATARPSDLVYLDPPWEGTTVGRDKRYHSGLERSRLEAALQDLVTRDVPFLLSYDGAVGGRVYGAPLDPSLGLQRVELHAGRSSQATLVGRVEHTVESLYVSPALTETPLAMPLQLAFA